MLKILTAINLNLGKLLSLFRPQRRKTASCWSAKGILVWSIWHVQLFLQFCVVVWLIKPKVHVVISTQVNTVSHWIRVKWRWPGRIWLRCLGQLAG